MPENKPDDKLALPQGVLLGEAMEALWNSNEQTVWDIVHKLNNKLGRALNYNTVSTILIRLCKMGLASRVRLPDSRTYVYSARISREQAEKAGISKAVQALFVVCRDPHLALSYLIRVIANSESGLLEELEELVIRTRQESKLDGDP
jgi:predicted transcriptional regulator